jgi:Protein of unknown function (DUF433)
MGTEDDLRWKREIGRAYSFQAGNPGRHPGFYRDCECGCKGLFDHLEAGDSIDDFLEGFPSVRREQVIAVLEEFRKELLQPA